jgi:O-antigen/teichoic acid export membrane protein
VISIAAMQLSWRFVAGGFAILTSLLVSVRLGLDTQGVVATSASLVAGLSVLIGSGFTHAAAFAVARRRESAGRIAYIAGLLAVGSGILGGVAVFVLGPRLLPTLPVLWGHIGFALPFVQFGQLGLGLQQGLGSSRGYVAVYIAQPLVAVSLAVTASLLPGLFGSASEWAGPIIVLPFVIQAAISAAASVRLPRRAEPEPLGPLLSYTSRIYPSAVAHYLSYRLDLLLVSGLLGATSAGVYSLALNAVDAVARIGQTAATVLFREFSESARAYGIGLARRGAILAGSLSLLVGGALALAVTLFASRGVEVAVLARLVTLLVLGGGAVSAWTVLASYLAANNKLAATARVNAVVLITSLVLYLSLIPILGVYGGAIGTSIGLAVAATLGYLEVGAGGTERSGATFLRNPFGK